MLNCFCPGDQVSKLHAKVGPCTLQDCRCGGFFNLALCSKMQEVAMRCVRSGEAAELLRMQAVMGGRATKAVD